MTNFLFRAVVLFAALLPAANLIAQSSFDLRSPNSRIELRIRTAGQLRYDVLLDGRSLLENCTLSLDIEHKKLGVEPRVTNVKERTSDQIVKPVVRQKFAQFMTATANCGW